MWTNRLLKASAAHHEFQMKLNGNVITYFIAFSQIETER